MLVWEEDSKLLDELAHHLGYEIVSGTKTGMLDDQHKIIRLWERKDDGKWYCTNGSSYNKATSARVLPSNFEWAGVSLPSLAWGTAPEQSQSRTLFKAGQTAHVDLWRTPKTQAEPQARVSSVGSDSTPSTSSLGTSSHRLSGGTVQTSVIGMGLIVCPYCGQLVKPDHQWPGWVTALVVSIMTLGLLIPLVVILYIFTHGKYKCPNCHRKLNY